MRPALRVVASTVPAVPAPSRLRGFDVAVRLRNIIRLVQSDVRSLDTCLGVEHLGFLVVQVLPRIGGLVFEHLDEHVKACRHE